MTRIYLDIETIPTQCLDRQGLLRAELEDERDKALERVKAPGNYRDGAKIEEYISQARQAIIDQHEAQVQAAIEKTSLDGAMGQIVCVSYAVDDADPICLAADDLSLQSEASLLELLWLRFSEVHSGTSGMRPVVVGHNVVGFDLPFLWHRSIVHQVRPPHWLPRNAKPWAEGVADTMLMWAGDKGRISMERLCRALGLPGKGAFSGADVWQAVQDGRLREVADYCSADVSRTRAIYRRLTFGA